MNRYYYDLHIHSCLSPCGDDDMTPNNIAGMAVLKGLNIIALTDHNSVKNCRAFYAAAKKNGLIPVAGIEMTTSEDIHIVALFPSLEKAEEFGAEYEKHRVLYKNRKEIFGNQLICDEDDNVKGEEEFLLLNASALSIADAVSLARSFGAAVFPAHIDRDENGIISSLGCVPEDENFSCVEFRSRDNIKEYTEKYNLGKKSILTDSDAHYLWDISEAENYLELEDEPYSSALVRENLLRFIAGK